MADPVASIRNAPPPREVPEPLLKVLCSRSDSGAHYALAAMLFAMMVPTLYLAWGNWTPCFLIPLLVCLIGVLFLLTPLLTRRRYVRLLRHGVVVRARVTRLEPPHTALGIWMDTGVSFRGDCEENSAEYRLQAKRHEYALAKESKAKGRNVYLLVDPALERNPLRRLWLPRFVVLDWCPGESDAGDSRKSQEIEPHWRLRYPTFFVILAACLTIGYCGAWMILDGAIPSSVGYPLVGRTLPGVLLALGGCGAVVFSIWSHRRKHDLLSRVVGSGAMIVLSVAILIGLEYANVRLDRSPGVPDTLTITDFLSLTSRFRQSGSKDTSFFIAFWAPDDLPQYRLVLVRDTRLNDPRFAPGRRFRLERHTGFFGKPWYRLLDPFVHRPGMDFASEERKRVLIEAEGFFAADSPYLQQLAGYGIPVHER